MNKIDSGYDTLLGSNFELHKTQLSELKFLTKSWYPNTNFDEFDNRYRRGDRDRGEGNFIEMKKAGLTSNYFFAYKEDDKYYLLDGFNRLFTDYGVIDFDCPVYVKLLTDKLSDSKIIKIMFHLNMWKLQGDGHANFKPDNFFDRGFRLLLSKKFNIDLYFNQDSEYKKRIRNNNDFYVLHHYFRRESSYSDSFAFSLSQLATLLENEKFLTDIRELIDANNYLEKPFKNYDYFLNGYAMFLSWRRVLGDTGEHKFKTYMNLLEQDKKLFKKLPTMSGTDSTRINVYNFFRGLYEKK